LFGFLSNKCEKGDILLNMFTQVPLV